MRDGKDELNIKSMRNMVESLILQLIERFGDSTTQAIMIVAEKFMMNYNEAHTSNIIQSFYEKTGELKMGADFTKDKLMEFVKGSSFDCTLAENIWKKREVGLFLLGSFSDDIIDF